MITFVLFSFIVIFVTIMYGLWAIIFPIISKPPKLFGFHKLKDYQWLYFKLKLAPVWFFRSAVPLAIINWIISYNLAGSVSFKEIFATDIDLFGKLLLSFSTYIDFFIGLGASYVTIFFIEFIIAILVMRHKASTRPEIEIVETFGDFNADDFSNTEEPSTPNQNQKQITD